VWGGVYVCWCLFETLEEHKEIELNCSERVIPKKKKIVKHLVKKKFIRVTQIIEVDTD
jgi:hypothetical protein